MGEWLAGWSRYYVRWQYSYFSRSLPSFSEPSDLCRWIFRFEPWLFTFFFSILLPEAHYFMRSVIMMSSLIYADVFMYEQKGRVESREMGWSAFKLGYKLALPFS